MLYTSTNRNASPVDFAEAVIAGQAPDGGLYVPQRIASLSPPSAGLARYAQTAVRVLAPYLGELLEASELAALCERAYPFEPVLEQLEEQLFLLRLDQGPSASFKDFGARFMALATEHLLVRRKQRLLILTATSGDTGSAVARAFHDIEGVEVLVLFPRDQVSLRQRKQMTSLGGNVRAAAVDGSFDQCQALVKRAFADPTLEGLHLSSANSINIGRLLPQMVYYVHAAEQVLGSSAAGFCDFVVPCGNLGNLVAGMMTRFAGLPIRRLVAATNANDELVRFLQTGHYQPLVPSRVCLSNAMNVGHPSNLARLVELFGGRMSPSGQMLEAPSLEAMRTAMAAFSIDDQSTSRCIAEQWSQRGLLLEPHGAVAWRAFERYRDEGAATGPTVLLETAHPAKFPEAILQSMRDPELSQQGSLREPALELPPSLQGIDTALESFEEITPDYPAFVALLRS